MATKRNKKSPEERGAAKAYEEHLARRLLEKIDSLKAINAEKRAAAEGS
jgi:hypothetical protein